MNIEAIKEYESLKLQIKTLTDKAKELEPVVTEALESVEEDQIETDSGKFYFTVRKSYMYTDAVKTKEAEVKELKKTEETSGAAECTEKKSLTYRAK
jgi:ABC-type transporter lipoprotein component MlaA